MGFSFLIFLCIVGGLQADKDFRNKTVECSFENINKCFNPIASLGANFSTGYAVNSADIKQVCPQAGPFQYCAKNVPQECNNQNPNVNRAIDSMVNFVNKLCTNGSVEQNNFLNSSVCYNKNQNKRKHCVQQFSTSKTDAKSLCCKSKKIQDCLKNDMKSACTSNSTVFQGRLIDTYSGYTNILCVPYEKYCNGVISNFLSTACLLLTAKLAFLNYIR